MFGHRHLSQHPTVARPGIPLAMIRKRRGNRAQCGGVPPKRRPKSQNAVCRSSSGMGISPRELLREKGIHLSMNWALMTRQDR